MPETTQNHHTVMNHVNQSQNHHTVMNHVNQSIF